MSENISVSRIYVMNSQVAKIEETLNEFKVDELRNYLKLCKQNSRVNFIRKILQTSDSCNTMGKSMLCVSNNNFIYKMFK